MGRGQEGTIRPRNVHGINRLDGVKLQGTEVL
jgi:hypothetical protein